MKSSLDARSEQEAIEGLRTEFEPRGFTVLPHPAKDRLPEFVGNFEPDVLLAGPDQNILVEIKRFRSSAEENLRAEAFAREVRKHKNWKFMLLLLRPDLPPLAGKEEVAKALSLFAFPDRGLKTKQDFIVAWMLFEAAARIAENRLDPDRSWRRLPTSAVVEKLTSLGAFDDETASKLEDWAEVRNQLVHGSLNVAIPKSATRRLLAEAQHLVEAAE